MCLKDRIVLKALFGHCGWIQNAEISFDNIYNFMQYYVNVNIKF